MSNHQQVPYDLKTSSIYFVLAQFYLRNAMLQDHLFLAKIVVDQNTK